MKVIKLTSEHIQAVRPLFERQKYMGVDADTKQFVQDDKPFADFFHESFVCTYLSDLKNFHAYGAMDDNGNIKAYCSFYESNDDASWYGTHIKSLGDSSLIKMISDVIIDYNEKNGRLKFYSMFNVKYIKSYRRLGYSQYNNERYDFFDEFYVPSRHQCIFSLPWQILYSRTLIPTDTVVRCSFLKQKYRKPFIAGRL